MRSRILVCVGLVLSVGVHAWAQDPPPPGFAPAQDNPGQNASGQDDVSRSSSFFNQFNNPQQNASPQTYDGGGDQATREQSA